MLMAEHRWGAEFVRTTSERHSLIRCLAEGDRDEVAETDEGPAVNITPFRERGRPR